MTDWRAGSRLVVAAPAAVFLATALAGGAVAQPVAAGPRASIQTTCELVVPSRCKGAYGFSVTADGAWQAGPDPGGRTLKGELDSSDRRAITEALTVPLDGRPCAMRPTMVPGVGETLVVTQGDRRITLHGTGGKMLPSCGEPGSSSAKVFALISALMQKYYPAQFPSQ